MLSPLKLFAIKLAIFSGVLAYLAIDLMIWKGPVWEFVKPSEAAQRRQAEAVATIYGMPMSREQLDTHVAEMSWLAGKPEPEVSACLDMLRSEIVRLRAHYNDLNLPSRRKEAEAEMARIESRSKSAADFDVLLASLGKTRASLLDEIETRLREQVLLERAIEKFLVVSDDDVDRHYELVKEKLRQPASRSLSHIFFCGEGADAVALKAEAENAMARLAKGANFASLARELSDDSRSAPSGGKLGMIPDSARNALPELALFGEDAARAGVPVLRESRWGWHVLLAGEIVPSSIPSLDICRESMHSALVSAQRELAVKAYFDASFKEAFHSKQLQIYVR